jgi:hypothetical protein
MMVDDGVTGDFGRLIEALRPYLPEIVVVGGWAYRLFAQHPLARPLDFTPLTTDDADVAVPLKLQARDASLRDLLKDAGFTEEMKGQDTPPVTHYRLGEGEFYVEFLAPKTGDGFRKSGERDATAQVQGVVVQKLPHVDVMLVSPWTVTPPVAPGSDQEPVEIRIPNATTFLAQKLLVLLDRTKEKQANDIVYIHDTLMMFAESLPTLAALWETIKPQLTKKQVRNVDRAIATIFGPVDDRIRRAAIIAKGTGRGAPPSAEQIRDRCAEGLRAIFGAS